MTKHFPHIADEAEQLALRDFDHYLRCLGLAKGDVNLEGPIEIARQHCSLRVQQLFSKAAQGGLTSGSGGLSGDERSLVTAFFASTRQTSAFERMRASTRQVPRNSRAVIVTTAASAIAGQNAEGAAKVMTTLNTVSRTAAKMKARATLAVSRELLQFGDEGVEGLLTDELRGAVSEATDEAFIGFLSTGVTPITSGAAPSDDIKALLDAVPPYNGSALHWVATAGIAGAVSALQASGGLSEPLPLSPGGMFLGLPFVITNFQIGSPPSEYLMLVDAAQLTTSDEGLTLRTSSQADLHLDDASAMNSTTPTGAALTSLFQTNSIGMIAERTFTVDRMRGSAVAVVENPSWAA